MEDRKGNRLIPFATEYFFHRTIQMYSDRGINLVVDQILHDAETFHELTETLQDYPMVFVGAHRPKEELIRREKARGYRQIGISASQLLFVHQQLETLTLKSILERILRSLV